MALTVYELNDIINSVLKHDLKGRMTNLDPTLLRGYPYANRIMRENIAKIKSGTDIKWEVNVDSGPTADNYGVYQTFTRTGGNSIKYASMQMKGTHSYYMFDVQEEDVNSGEHQLVDHIKNKDQNAQINLVKKIESQGWGNADSTDNLAPQGFLYWLPHVSSATVVQTGTYPSGYTDVAGLSATTYPAHASWGATYTAVVEADLIDKLDTVMTETRFMSPLTSMLIKDFSTGWDWALYCRYSVLKAMKLLAKQQNDNLGFDLDPADGRTAYRGIMVEDVPYLANDTRNSVIGVNWGVTKHFVQREWWMKRMKAPGVNEQPLVTTWDIFCKHQLVMHDRRTGGFRLSLAA